MIKQTFTQKETGDSLSASEWNEFTGYVNTAVDAINAGAAGVVTVTDETASGGDPTVGVTIASCVQQVGSPKVIELTKKKKGVNTTITSENNINFEPRESVGETKGGNISFKPGDDIEFCSHHRLEDNQDEVSIKVIDGDDNPVKLQLNAAEMTLTTKGKTGNDAAVFDVNVNSAKNTKGYLKVRAQAIDLRCESHGGIALQPKGEDGQGNMNKIKFEHGGGDGLEFGTFNAKKSSLYTDEYRFKKDGVIKLATRTKQVSDKYDNVDETTHYKYVKAADDFYDNVSIDDPTCTWEDIVNAGKNTKHFNLANSYSSNHLDYNLEDTYTSYINEYGSMIGGPIDQADFTEFDTYYHNDTGNHINTYDLTYVDPSKFDFLSGISASFVDYLCNTSQLRSALYDYIDALFDEQLTLTGTQMDPSDFISAIGDLPDGELFAINLANNKVLMLRKNLADFNIYLGNKSVSMRDVITLIDFFKSGAGVSQGPWATNL